MNTPAYFLVAVAISATLSAQSKPPEAGNLAYDVVSIKPNKSGESGGSWGRAAWWTLDHGECCHLHHDFAGLSDEG